jgi:hypothetical protein
MQDHPEVLFKNSRSISSTLGFLEELLLPLWFLRLPKW